MTAAVRQFGAVYEEEGVQNVEPLRWHSAGLGEFTQTYFVDHGVQQRINPRSVGPN